MAPILIVGAGPVGLVLALSLLRNGVPVRIINKQTTHSVGQRGSGLQARTLELYKVLGILPQVMERSGKLPCMRMYSSPEGPKPLKEFSMMEDLEPTPQYPIINCAMISQDRHEALLRDILAKEYDTHVEMGAELISFAQTPDHVEARIVKRIDEKEIEETANFEFLVGTDGARSVVRKQLGLTFLGESREGHASIIGDLEVKKGLPDREYWYGWGDGQRLFVSLRPWETDGDLYNVLIAGTSVDAQKLESDREEMFKTINAAIGRELEFGDVLCVGVWSPNIRMVDKFGEGRVFIGGDAAHVHSPNGGQGLNTGVQDAINLAWKLAIVQKRLAPLSLLSSYNDERLPIIAVMLQKTKLLLDKTFSAFEAKEGDFSSFKKDFELRQHGVNYRGSAAVVDEKHPELGTVDPYRSGLDGKAKGGDRAPAAAGLVNAKDGSETSLYDLLSPSKHTLLVFATEEGEKEDLPEKVSAVSLSAFPKDTIQTIVVYPQSGASITASTDHVVADKDGYAFKNYNVSKTDKHRVFVIRPDGYIGAVVEGEKGLKEYVKAVFGI